MTQPPTPPGSRSSAWFQEAVLHKKAALTEMLEAPMAALAEAAADVWPDADALDRVLAEYIRTIPHCHLLYALSHDGRQLSSNVTPEAVETDWRDQALAGRPFHSDRLPFKGFMLSTVYLSNISRKRCITAIQAVNRDDTLLGFIAADFNLDDVPQTQSYPETQREWTQYKGDPSIRGMVFEQQRQKSALDARLDEAITTIDTLMREHGVYHVILHFSSSRAIFWVYDDPYVYKYLSVDEFLDPEIWLAYPAQPYPARAKVPAGQIRAVLERFKSLREADENIYLRSASLNVINGIVGLTFSCDGSHYMPVGEFLSGEHPFWM